MFDELDSSDVRTAFALYGDLYAKGVIYTQTLIDDILWWLPECTTVSTFTALLFSLVVRALTPPRPNLPPFVWVKIAEQWNAVSRLEGAEDGGEEGVIADTSAKLAVFVEDALKSGSRCRVKWSEVQDESDGDLLLLCMSIVFQLERLRAR